jgi:hypothetical protein
MPAEGASTQAALRTGTRADTAAYLHLLSKVFVGDVFALIVVWQSDLGRVNWRGRHLADALPHWASRKLTWPSSISD